MTQHSPAGLPTATSGRISETSAGESVSTSPLLTVEQAAERLGTPVRFVRRLVAQRRINFCRVGRYVRIAPSDLASFIDAGRVVARAERGADGHQLGRV
jgi:excisionase family DNA binding protein